MREQSSEPSASSSLVQVDKKPYKYVHTMLFLHSTGTLPVLPGMQRHRAGWLRAEMEDGGTEGFLKGRWGLGPSTLIVTLCMTLRSSPKSGPSSSPYSLVQPGQKCKCFNSGLELFYLGIVTVVPVVC